MCDCINKIQDKYKEIYKAEHSIDKAICYPDHPTGLNTFRIVRSEPEHHYAEHYKFCPYCGEEW